ncbi:MAG: TolC family protein [Verrucomicrobiales bacterium]|nr:TolC family protein [Verrucomicrobiales bacterium]MCP5560257.1 TolC family protein [Verrucomicrobiaceae bacterium]
MQTRNFLPVLVLILGTAALAADTPAPLTSALLGRLIREAVSTHPSMAAAEARSQAAASAIGAVRLWEDPQIGLGVTSARQRMRMDAGDIRLGIDQMIPRHRLYGAEKRRAAAGLQVQQAAARQTANELGLAVAESALELALADELIRIQNENLSWLKTIVGITQERSKNPDSSPADTLKLESELAVREQTLASLRRQRTQYAATLNLLLGRPTDSPWSSLKLSEENPEMRGVEVLREKLRNGNPRLEALRHEAEVAQAEADAAKEKRKPIFSVGVETNTYSGGDFRGAMFGVKMTLPWLHRSVYAADIARAESMSAAANDDLAAQERGLHSQLIALLTEVENNQRIVQAYTDEVLPKSEKAVETLQSAWVSSKATLLDVLDSRRALLDALQEKRRAVAAVQVAEQGLAALTGKLIQTHER